jgi:Inner membrane protein YgaP-like, transmembrane domain
MSSKALSANEHAIDRAIRVILGIVLLALVFVGPKTLWGLVGIVPLATGLVGICPLYSLIGVSTKGGGERPAAQS